MIRNSRSHIFFSLFFQALAVAIISVGSLINFHQYKIWGKPLIPQFVGIKREADDHSKVFTTSGASQNHHLTDCPFPGPACLFSECGLITTGGHSWLPAFDHPDWLPTPSGLLNIGLRAPPVA